MPQLCTITGGAFQDALGNPVTGILKLRITEDAQQGTVQLSAGRTVTVALLNGNVSGTVSVWSPQVYESEVISDKGLSVWSGVFVIPDAASYSLTP